MLKIGIIDDCVGIFPTYYKLKQAVSADFICIISDVRFTDMPRDNLIAASYEMTKRLTELGCDAIVLSSVSLSSLAYKKLQNLCGCPLYSSDAPVLHASTYTASGVLVAGNGRVVNRLSSPTVIPCAMDEFPLLAESGNERVIVEYVEKKPCALRREIRLYSVGGFRYERLQKVLFPRLSQCTDIRQLGRSGA